RVFSIGECDVYAKFFECMCKQCMSAAVQAGCRNDMVPGDCNGLHCICDCSHSGGNAHPCNTTFQLRNAYFKCICRRVHESCIYISCIFQTKQIGCVFSIIKSVGCCLIDWQST